MKTETSVRTIYGTSRKPGIWNRIWKQRDIQLMVIPGLLILFVFSYIPMWGVLMAFQDFSVTKGFLQSPWVGIKHFRMFFEDPNFWPVMRNTVFIGLLKLAIAFPAPILLALMLNEVKFVFFKRFIQTVSYLPHFMSWVIISGLMISLLSVDGGNVNGVLLKLGIIHEPINFLSETSYFWTILVSANVWKEIGFGAIVYLAAITGVDPHLYEAASIDGSGRIRQIVSITIPSIVPVILILFILQVGQTLNAGFEDILMLTNKGANTVLRPVSEVIDTYVYRIGIVNYRFSYATAAGLFKAIVNIGLLTMANMLTRKMAKTSLW